MAAYFPAEAVRAVAGNRCVVAVFLPTCTNMVIRKTGPEELGGLGNLRAKFEARVAAGVDPKDAADQVGYKYNLDGYSF
jgi:hypothetical protein